MNLQIQYEGDETINPSEHIKTLITMQFLGDGKDMTEKGPGGQREIYVEQMIYRQKPLWVYLGQHKPLGMLFYFQKILFSCGFKWLAL